MKSKLLRGPKHFPLLFIGVLVLMLLLTAPATMALSDEGGAATSSTSSSTESTLAPNPEPTSDPVTTSEPAPPPAPTIVSDQPDYPPGSKVILTGENWQGDTSVHVVVNDTLGQTWFYETDAEVQEDGTITVELWIAYYFISDYDVVATGNQTGRVATTTFTDDAPGLIGGLVYNDLNGNGAKDGPGEPGINGLTVRIYTDDNANGVLDPGETTFASGTTSGGGNQAGSFAISRTWPGKYIVVLVKQSGWAQTAPAAEVNPGVDAGAYNRGWAVTLTDSGGGRSSAGNDFGIRTTIPITVTAHPKSKVYGDADPAFTFQITSGSLLPGDGWTGSLTRVAGENVGTYQIQRGTLTFPAYYAVTYVGANLTIEKRPLTVTADAKTKTYGDDDPALTYQVTSGSLKSGDSFTGALSRDPGENVGSYAITKGTLAIADGNDGNNYNLTYVGANLTIEKRPLTVTADNKTKVFGAPVPELTASAGPLQFSDTLESLDLGFALSTTATAASPVGTYPISISGGLTETSNYGPITYVGGTLTVKQVQTNVKAYRSALWVQYSDVVTLWAVVTPETSGEFKVGGSVTFTINGLSYGPASVQPTGTGQAMATLVTQIWNLPGGPWDVEAAFTSSDPNWSDSDNSGQPPVKLGVLPEDAERIGESFWTGEDVYWTATPTSDGATVTLVATFKDADDDYPGDVRAGKISFYTGPTSTGPWTKVGNAQDLPVGLVDLQDGSVGTAGGIAQFNLKSTELNATWYVRIVIGGAYTGSDVASFAVARAKNGQIFGVGARLEDTTSAGAIRGSSVANFNVVYTKSGTNPQGKVSIRITSWYKPDGTLDSKLHYYQVDTNAIASLSASAATGTATFSAKATVKELFFNEAMELVATVSLDGGAIVQLAMTDSSGGDKLAVTVQKSAKTGGLWYSSNWNGQKTVEQAVTDGSIIVR